MPSSGPHWPKVARIVYPPARLLSVAWMFATHARSRATDANTCTEKKIEKYLTPGELLVALIMKPMAAIKADNAQNGPRILKRSER